MHIILAKQYRCSLITIIIYTHEKVLSNVLNHSIIYVI